MKLHILTLTWNGKKRLEALAPTLVSSCNHLSHDPIWYIRDNGSKDDTLEYLMSNDIQKDKPLKLKVLSVDHNRDSFARCVNSLLEMANPADEDLVMLLNDDVVFFKNDSIQKMIDLQDKTGAGIVGARLLYLNTNKLQHAGIIFSKRYNSLPFHFRPGEESDKNSEKNRYFQAVTAACCIVKASSLKKINGMDEGFRWAFDDVDMNFQIGKNLGEKIAYCGNVGIYHEESVSLKKNPVNKLFMDDNVKRFRSKWNGKYTIDHDMYLGNSLYNEIKV